MRIIKKMCLQTACYWPPLPHSDDFGNPTYGDVVELKPPDNGVAWFDTNENYINQQGETTVSKAKVFVLQDLQVHGVLWLGQAKDLADDIKPFGNAGASEIQAFSKIPTLTANEFVRTAWL
jgi:hypothetical protein